MERANRSILEKLNRYMTFKKTLNWTSVLQEAIDSLNSKPMKVLNWLTPKDARLPNNEKLLKLKFYQDRENYSLQFKNKKPVFQIGDTVLVVKKPISVGYKGYKNNTLPDVEEITRIYHTAPITYGLKYGRRKYYADELRYYSESSKVDEPSTQPEPSTQSEPGEPSAGELDEPREHGDPTGTPREPHESTRPDYYIAETRERRKSLRSGAVHGQVETEFLLKSYSNPDFQLWVSEEDKKKLEDESKLLP